MVHSSVAAQSFLCNICVENALHKLTRKNRNCGTLNEFRKFVGLKQYHTFEEINPDPYVAEQLKNLYEHPDFVELYPGITAEAAKDPLVIGVGICPTYTISRAGKFLLHP